MFAVFKVQQRPQLRVAAQYNMSATPTIATIGAALGYKLFAVKMRSSRPALTAAAKYLNVINKVLCSHVWLIGLLEIG
jgi:hypothetical protein